MKNRKKETETNAGFQAETMTDLPIADEPAEEVRAGRAAVDYKTVSGKITAIAVDE